MFWLELQSQMMRSWLDLAGASATATTQTSLDMTRNAMQAWSGAVTSMATSPASQPATALAAFAAPPAAAPAPFGAFGAPSALPFFAAPFWGGSAMMAPVQAFWSMTPSTTATLPFPFSVFSAMVTPPRQPDIFDVMAASYRTASGYATAAIVKQVEAPAPQTAWWMQPYGRSWLN